MPCHSAIVKKNVISSPEDSIEKVLKAIQKGKVNASAIVDADGHFLGLFSIKILLKGLIPVSIAMAGGVEIDLKVTAAPGIAKRLENVKTLPVSEFMDKKAATIFPDLPTWEGVSLLLKNGEPLSVVDHNGKFCGLITYNSLVADLEDMQSTDS